MGIIDAATDVRHALGHPCLVQPSIELLRCILNLDHYEKADGHWVTWKPRL